MRQMLTFVDVWEVHWGATVFLTSALMGARRVGSFLGGLDSTGAGRRTGANESAEGGFTRPGWG